MIITIYLGFSLDHLWIYTKVEEHISLPWKQWFISLVHLYKKSERLREWLILDNIGCFYLHAGHLDPHFSHMLKHQLQTPASGSKNKGGEAVGHSIRYGTPWKRWRHQKSNFWNSIITLHTITKLGAAAIFVKWM